MDKKLYLIAKDSENLKPFTFEHEGKIFNVVPSDKEKSGITFSDIDEESENEVKIWMRCDKGSRLVTTTKSIFNLVEFGHCQAKYFEANYTKFPDRSLVDPNLVDICARKTTTIIKCPDGVERHFCRWHRMHCLGY